MTDLIYVFQDIEGEHIQFDHKEDAFRLLPQVLTTSLVFQEGGSGPRLSDGRGRGELGSLNPPPQLVITPLLVD